MRNLIILAVVMVLGLGAYQFLIKKDTSMAEMPTTQTENTPPVTTPKQNPIVKPATVPATPPKPTTTPVATTPAPAPAEVTISLKNYSFNPSTITVKVGTKVTWINDDSVGHTVTSDSDGLLNSGTLSSGGKYSYTFTAPGTTTYHCVPHQNNMRGTIVVTN